MILEMFIFTISIPFLHSVFTKSNTIYKLVHLSPKIHNNMRSIPRELLELESILLECAVTLPWVHKLLIFCLPQLSWTENAQECLPKSFPIDRRCIRTFNLFPLSLPYMRHNLNTIIFQLSLDHSHSLASHQRSSLLHQWSLMDTHRFLIWRTQVDSSLRTPEFLIKLIEY